MALGDESRIIPQPIEQEMRTSYLDYAMSVIVSRALPDARDGLKPVQRRILYAMWEAGLRPDHPYRKVAAVVGDVMKKYHPHGDVPIFEALVRMAQPWAFRYPLVDGQGNFGCFTGDMKIKLLDGTERSFAELAKLPPNEGFFVYSVDRKGRIVVGEARHSRVTRRSARLVEVTLDNGERIRCTPDHLFMLRDGTYTETRLLSRGESLMSAYFDATPVKAGLNEYLRVLQPLTGCWEFVHHIADQFNEERGLPEPRGPFVRHHKNFDRWDNRPSNIERMSFLEHLHLHAESIGQLWAKEEFRVGQGEAVRRYYAEHPEVREERRRRFREQNRSAEFRRENGKRVAKSIRAFYARNPGAGQEISRRMKALWSDQDYRVRMKAVLTNVEKRPLTREEKERIGQIISIRSRAMWGDDAKRAEIVNAISAAMASKEVREKLRESGRRNWENPEFRAKFPAEHFSKMARVLWQSPATRIRSRRVLAHLRANPKFRDAQREGVGRSNVRRMGEDPEMMRKMAARAAESLARKWKDADYKKQVLRQRIARYVSDLLAQMSGTQVTPEVYEASRKANWIPRLGTALRYFRDFEEVLEAGRRYNHRVVSVVWLDETADVYDITVEEHHNFLLASGVFVHNSVDGDPPAAMRYVESRLTPLAMELLADIERDTVDFVPNYDEYEKEPVVLPSKVPHLLMNGASGIAVGMATNIPPHNIGELVDGLVAMIDDPKYPTEELLKVIKGPDFPTGGQILGRDGIKAAYESGRGSITVRGKAEMEELRGGRMAIVVTELPFYVNKSALIQRIAELVRDKKLNGVSDLRDESDRRGMRIVIELRREVNPQIVRNLLFKHTQLQTTFGAIMLALVDGAPKTLGLRELLEQYLRHRRTVVIRRTQFDLAKAEARAHILEGLKIALKALDDVIALIRKSKDVPTARAGLMKQFKLSEAQADAILEIRLQRLTALEREKIDEEYKFLVKEIAKFKEMLTDATSPRPRLIMAAIRDELLEMKEKYGDARRTKITGREAEEFEAEDLIPDADIVITLTQNSYIKRQPLETYRLQRRGTRGVIGMGTKEEDFVQHAVITTNHAFLLFFTDRGKVYRLKAHEVPEAGRTARGTALVNLLALAQGERVNAIIPLRSFEDEGTLFMATRRGVVKRTGLMEFINAKRAGIVAISLERDDRLVGVRLIGKETEIVLATRQGKAIRFRGGQVREMGRAARGVVGIRLRGDDEVVGVADVTEGPTLLTVTELGFGKRTPIGQYPLKRRGGMGVINLKVSKKVGPVVTVRAVEDDDEILLVTSGGVFNRIPAAQISVMGRQAQGVHVMRVEAGERVAATARIAAKE